MTHLDLIQNDYLKKIYIFFTSIRMRGKSINLDDKKDKKKLFLQKQETVQDR